jgi:hypothetical protein
VGTAVTRLLTAVITIAAAWTAPDGTQRRSSAIRIDTLSSRSDMVSGGDALVQVRVADGAQSSRVVVALIGVT